MWLDVLGACRRVLPRVPRRQKAAVGAGAVCGGSHNRLSARGFVGDLCHAGEADQPNSQNLNSGVGSRLARGQHK